MSFHIIDTKMDYTYFSSAEIVARLHVLNTTLSHDEKKVLVLNYINRLAIHIEKDTPPPPNAVYDLVATFNTPDHLKAIGAIIQLIPLFYRPRTQFKASGVAKHDLETAMHDGVQVYTRLGPQTFQVADDSLCQIYLSKAETIVSFLVMGIAHRFEGRTRDYFSFAMKAISRVMRPQVVRFLNHHAVLQGTFWTAQAHGQVHMFMCKTSSPALQQVGCAWQLLWRGTALWSLLPVELVTLTLQHLPCQSSNEGAKIARKRKHLV